MTPAAALAELRAAGVRVELRPDGTVSLEAAAPPLPELLDAARRHRDEIAGLLRAESGPSTAGQIGPAPPASASAAGTVAEINEAHCSDQVLGRSERSEQCSEDEPADWDEGPWPEVRWDQVPTQATVDGLLESYKRHCGKKP